jgi:hypothetical protein
MRSHIALGQTLIPVGIIMILFGMAGLLILKKRWREVSALTVASNKRKMMPRSSGVDETERGELMWILIGA